MGAIFSFLAVTCHIPTLYYARTPIQVAVRKIGNINISNVNKEKVSIKDFIEANCPSLSNGFRPAWWLSNGHLQTMWSVIGDFSKIDKVEYDRKLLHLKDGGTLGLDFTPPVDVRALPDGTPIVVVLHGLTGGSHESYVRAILAPAVTPVEEGGLGYRGIVVNSRGCAGTPITSPRFYSIGDTDDLRQALLYISHMYPRAPLLGVGFSLGANLLTRYLGQEGEKSRLQSGCVLGCPWDLVANSNRLEETWFYRQVYSKALASNLIRLMHRHLSALSQHISSSEAPKSTEDPKAAEVRITKFAPDQIDRAATAVANVLSLPPRPTLREFDDAFTRLVGGPCPPFPFSSAIMYRQWAASHQYIDSVRVPVLALNADDDPVVPHLPFGEVEAQEQGWVVMAVTPGGGHLGWFTQVKEGKNAFFGGVRRWVSKPVVEWLKAVGGGMVPPPRELPKVYLDGEGWLRQEGWDERLGCREVEGVEHVIGAEGEEGLLLGL